ncbi:hypothetical protein CHKEEEPN_3210 [Methylorubrum podarium]|nr:hypothetical protein CHKEEEPN_3210 [Methylorubrum podarium]
MKGASRLAGARAWASTSSQCPIVPNSPTAISSAQSVPEAGAVQIQGRSGLITASPPRPV